MNNLACLCGLAVKYPQRALCPNDYQHGPGSIPQFGRVICASRFTSWTG